MPLKLSPDETIDVCLSSDKEVPIESRPVFVAKVQTMRGQRLISAAVDRWSKPEGIESPDVLYDETVALLKTLLVDWRNMGMAFDLESLEDLLTYIEARELISLIQYGQNMTEAEKKS